jgi:hypothetical protein
MKKALIVAAALGVLTLPAFAQGVQPSGTRAGGPGQVGAPGEVGTAGGQGAMKAQMAPRKKMMRKKMRRTSKKQM